MSRVKSFVVKLLFASIVANTVLLDFNDSAFAIQNEYSNNLLKVNLEKNSNGTVDVSLYTSKPYSGKLTPIKHSDTEYVIVLPETYHSITAKPEAATAKDSVKNVDVKLLPYVGTGANNGYTKITIKTAPNTVLNVNNQVVSGDNSAVDDIDNVLAENKSVKTVSKTHLAVKIAKIKKQKSESKTVQQNENKKIAIIQQKPVEKKLEKKAVKIAQPPAERPKKQISIQHEPDLKLQHKVIAQQEKPVVATTEKAVVLDPQHKLSSSQSQSITEQYTNNNEANNVDVAQEQAKLPWISAEIKSVIENNLGNTFGLLLLASAILLIIVLLKLFSKKENKVEPRDLFSSDFKNKTQQEHVFEQEIIEEAEEKNIFDSNFEEQELEDEIDEEFYEEQENIESQELFEEDLDYEPEMFDEQQALEESEQEYESDILVYEQTQDDEDFEAEEINENDVDSSDDLELPFEEEDDDDFEIPDYVLGFADEETDDDLAIPEESMEEAEENIEYPEENPTEQTLIQPEEEAIGVICEKEIAPDKTLYLVDMDGQKALVGAIGSNIFVLNKFDYEITTSKIAAKLNERTESKEIYLVQIEKWRALIGVNSDKMELMLVL